MPRCEGRPDGPCPDGRNDNTVRGIQGDLMLCRSCGEFRFPSLPISATITRQVIPGTREDGEEVVQEHHH